MDGTSANVTAAPRSRALRAILQRGLPSLVAALLVLSLPSHVQAADQNQQRGPAFTCRASTPGAPAGAPPLPGDKYDDECNRQLRAIATTVYNTLMEQRTSNANDAWAIAYASARKLVAFTPLASTAPSPSAEPARRQGDGFSQRVALMARLLLPILRGQNQSENVAWSLAYGLSYQLITLVDVPGSHWGSSAGPTGACVDTVIARLVGNEILKYGGDPVLGMPNYMAEYIHKVAIRISDNTREPLALDNNVLIINPRLYTGAEPLFGPVVTARLAAEQLNSQTSVVKLKALMGTYWQDVANSNGWGDTIEVKQLHTYQDAVSRNKPVPDVKSALLAIDSTCQ